MRSTTTRRLEACRRIRDALGFVRRDVITVHRISSPEPEFVDLATGRPFKAVAADLDMTSSELSRKLGDNPNDPVHFPLHLLPELIRATGDKRPVYWMVESFLEDPVAKRARAVAQLADLLPQLTALMKAAGGEPALKAVA